jgi:hypothetical protein
VLAKVLGGERSLDEKEQEQDVEETLDTRVGKGQRCRALFADCNRPLGLLERDFADAATWPMRWTSSRRRLAAKPILRNCASLTVRRPIPKSRVSLEGRLGSKRGYLVSFGHVFLRL